MAVVDLQEIRLSEVEEAARWDELVSYSQDADVYHRAAYAIATAEVEHSQPLGLVVTTQHQQFLLPMLLRTIGGPADEKWVDASTPYGYGGVICLHPMPNPLDLFQGLQTWLASRKLVCCVLRSHPLLQQEWLFSQVSNRNIVRVTRRVDTTALSLDRWDQDKDCLPGLSKGRRSDLAFARRNLRVACNASDEPSEVLKQLRIFRDLYESTMHRVSATEFFHFPWSYYERLVTLAPDLTVAVTWHGRSPVGSALFLAGRKYAHYHLSASDEAGRRFKASTLLVVEGARWARERGCRNLHLGGGMTVNDSLMAFKRSFGGDEHRAGHIMLVGDHDRYEAMSSAKNCPWPYHDKISSPTIHTNAKSALRVIFLGKDKPVVFEGLAHLVKNGFHVVAVVGPQKDTPTGSHLVDIAAKHHIPVTTDTQLYDVLEARADPETIRFSLQNIDLVVSLLFWKRIRNPLINLPRIACINFHPAPLPEFRGVGGYNLAILENLNYWGVAAHKVDETFDTGELIEVRRFDIDASRETAFSLEQQTQGVLLALFKETMDKIQRENTVIGTPQGEGRYFSKEDFERLRRIQPEDTAETIQRKVRAFWYPPKAGASILVNGNEYTLVNENILEWIKKMHP